MKDTSIVCHSLWRFPLVSWALPYSQSGLMHSELILTLFLRRAAPSAEFSVDRTRHLMSFLTMLGPSPDWNVGLSAEDLCTKECGWVQKVVQDLIPWDAGTDSGVSYEVGTNFIKLNVICYKFTLKQWHSKVFFFCFCSKRACAM